MYEDLKFMYINFFPRMYSLQFFLFIEQKEWTALYCAAQEGRIPALQLLLDKGAAIEAKATVSQTNQIDI